MQMLFSNLYIFAPLEKRAKHVSFTPGINVVTSDKIDGANRGKSVVMRSLYYALGAESYYEDKFDIRTKVVVLEFFVDEKKFYILRANRLYRIFDADRSILFSHNNASDLARSLSLLTQFAVELPNRANKELEVAPPVYNYLPFYLDQDYYNGTDFLSFKNLSQYSNYKSDVLDYHLGVFTKDYYTLVKELEGHKQTQTNLQKRCEVLNELLSTLLRKTEGKSVSDSEETLRVEINRYQTRYNEVLQDINNVRTRLLSLRNEVLEIESVKKRLGKYEESQERNIKKLLSHNCPTCGTFLADTSDLRCRCYNHVDNGVMLLCDLEEEWIDVKKKIDREELRYNELIGRLKSFDQELKIDQAKIKDILLFRGLSEAYNDSSLNLSKVKSQLQKVEGEIDEISKKLKEVKAKKREINARYNEYMLEIKMRFGFKELMPEAIESINKRFLLSGSDRSLSTVSWYTTVIRLRNEFNPGAVKFPMVFDSPKNSEMDETKIRQLFNYLIECAPLSGQLIVSGIGLSSDDFASAEQKDVNIVNLKNPPFELLQKDDFDKYHGLLEDLLRAKDDLQA